MADETSTPSAPSTSRPEGSGPGSSGPGGRPPGGRPSGPGGGGRKFFRRKKVCKFCVEKIDAIHYRDVRLLQLAVTMTVLAFIGFGGTIWPYVIPYHISIAQGAGDPTSIKFALVGIVLVLPVVLTYQLFAYRVFRGKAEDVGGFI